MTIVDARRLLDRDGELELTLPPLHVPRSELELALA